MAIRAKRLRSFSIMLNPLISRAPALLLGLLVVLFAAVPLSAQARSIDDAFKNLLGSQTNVSYTKPGSYSSQARNTFVAGGVDVRFPTTRTPALYSVTPFSMSAGCSGVSMHFGGLSFISGEEIKTLIENVAQNAEGVAIELVMTVLCGPCAHVMQVMRSLATAAARTALDSCQVARNLVEGGAVKFFGYEPNRVDKQSYECSQLCTESNKCAEWVASLTSGLCDGAKNTANFLEEYVMGTLEAIGGEGSGDPETKAAALCKVGVQCNTLWTAMNESKELRGVDEDKVRAKVLLMNVIGTNLACGTDAKCIENMTGGGAKGQAAPEGVTKGANDVYTFPPQLGNVSGDGSKASMQDVFTLFMCGTNWDSAGASPYAQEIIRSYCEVPGDSPHAKFQAQLAQLPVWDCEDPEQCLVIKKVPLGASSLVGSGYLPKVVNLIYDAVSRVRRNTALSDEQIQLIQVIPSVPLYQAINAAAVYPDAGGNLVALMSTYTAQLLAYAHIRDIIRQAEKLDRSNSLSADAYDRIYAFLGGMRAATMKAREQMSQSMVMQQALMEQIRLINLAMQREVMSTELLGTARFATAVTEAASKAAGAK